MTNFGSGISFSFFGRGFWFGVAERMWVYPVRVEGDLVGVDTEEMRGEDDE